MACITWNPLDKYRQQCRHIKVIKPIEGLNLSHMGTAMCTMLSKLLVSPTKTGNWQEKREPTGTFAKTLGLPTCTISIGISKVLQNRKNDMNKERCSDGQSHHYVLTTTSSAAAATTAPTATRTTTSNINIIINIINNNNNNSPYGIASVRSSTIWLTCSLKSFRCPGLDLCPGLGPQRAQQMHLLLHHWHQLCLSGAGHSPSNPHGNPHGPTPRPCGPEHRAQWPNNRGQLR